AIVGAGLALLFAPHSGKKTRKDITRYARKTRNKTEDLASNLMESLSGLVDEISEKTSDALTKGKDLTADAKKEILKAIDRQKEKIEKILG
ncbi:MAG: YtxH domain-containing protein, partial [Nitrospirae bacterium]|nr:YtxH domain-containing protein [Nitrospirota bacterium]